MTAQSSADGLMPFIDPGLDDLTREFCHAARYWFDQSGHLVAVWGVGTNGHFGVSWDRWLKRQDIAPLRAARSCERLAGQLLERVRQRVKTAVVLRPLVHPERSVNGFHGCPGVR